MKRPSRRSLLLGAATGAVGVTGLTIAGKTLLQATTIRASRATTKTCTQALTGVQDILSIALTVEQLAVTFYSNGLAHAQALGIGTDDKLYLKAAQIEEQLHARFLEQAGGKALTGVFSFPSGPAAFSNLATFITIQQQIEGLFDSIYVGAVREFGLQDRLDLASIATQIACVEAEHRIIGRLIGRMKPADNWAFAPMIFSSVGDITGIIQHAGYLSPIEGNSFRYQPAEVDDPNITYRSPFSVTCS